jgi:hypothetical protein
VQAEEYVAAKRAYEAQQAEVAHLSEMVDKFDLSKNTAEHNKKTKRTPSAMAQVSHAARGARALAACAAAGCLGSWLAGWLTDSTETAGECPLSSPTARSLARSLVRTHRSLQVKSRENALRKMEEKGLLEDPDRESGFARVRLDFPPPPPLKKPQLVVLDKAAVGYAGCAPLIANVCCQVGAPTRPLARARGATALPRQPRAVCRRLPLARGSAARRRARPAL